MKKIFTLFALMVMTVAVVATGYTVKRAAATAEYTDQLAATGGWMFGEGTTTSDVKLQVTDNGDGTYDFNFPSLEVQVSWGPMSFGGDVVFKGIKGTTDANGYTVYSGNVSATGAVSAEMEVNGKSKDGKMYIELKGTFYGQENVTLTYGTAFADETPKATVYTTNKVKSVYRDAEVEQESATVEITEAEEGKYNVTFKQFKLSDTTIGDFTAEGVDGTVDEDGYVNYTFDGNATVTNVAAQVTLMGILEEGGTLPFKIEGKSKDGELAAKFTTTFLGADGNVYFGDYTEKTPDTPDTNIPEGTVVGTDGYEPNGAAFSWTTPIDWDKQKLVASIDLTNCKNTFENILSVGEGISGWGDGNRLHLYYTASTKTLQPNFMAPDNVSRFNLVLDSNELTIELSKRYGLVINGQPWLYDYNTDEITTGTTYSDLDAFIEATKTFWALTSLEVGSTQGDTRSNAKYNYIRIVDLPEKEPAIVSTETFTDHLLTVDANTNEHNMDGKTLDINTYDDGTYGVTFHGVETADDVLGDITVKGISAVETEDGVVYGGEELTTTITDENSSLYGKEVKVTVTGQKNADGTVLFSFEITCDDDPDFFVAGQFGTEKTPFEPQGTEYKGSWSVGNPEYNFDGSVWAEKNDDGTYTFYVNNFTISDNNVGSFIVKNVPATEAADGSIKFGNETGTGTYDVVYPEGKPSGAIETLQWFYGTLKDNQLELIASYVNYDGGQISYAKFNGYDSSINGINGINADAENGNAEIFTIGGAKTNSLQKGINIVRHNGKTVKVIKK